MRALKLVFLASAAVTSTAGGLTAATTIYTDRAAFDIATGGSLSFEDFSDNNLTGFSGVTNAAFIQNNAIRDRPTPGGASTTYTFNSPITAFGADFDLTPGGAGTGLRFVLDGNEIVSQELNGLYVGFWGFVADTTFTTLRSEAGSSPGSAETHTLDNFSFGVAVPPVSPVPIPAGLPMLLAAIAGMFGWRRWQGRASKPA